MSFVPFTWFSIVTLLFILGEALALFLGLFILQHKSAWRTWKNSALLYSDILFSSITLFIFQSPNLHPLIRALWGFLLISHLYRIVESSISVQVPFF